ncbi:response regulator [Rhodobium gokarnense]|uniref:DNA-binding response OmpR family regulator n=1 Tax=Rhodobium gokarnense TaxID=364296 RepID=A0ABT3HGU9_9HYPH|nr:response regulator [Rhodobium gokarnense]MCW2309623.1 DNA-binding response OmpR family regulator [Rhodobium gokarnense]
MTQTNVTDLHFIDDSPDEFMITRLCLRREKINVTLSTYAEFDEFEKKVLETEGALGNSDLVVVDLNLTVSSGIDAVRALRRNKNCEGLIVGICTGSEDPKDRLDAMRAGADFFVTKPLNGAALERICEVVNDLACVSETDGGRILVRQCS